MSIENVREKLQSARQDLVSGHENAERGRVAADEAFSRYAEAEGHRNQLFQRAVALRLLLNQARTELASFGDEVYKAANMQEWLDETSREAGALFDRAKNYGMSAQTKLSEVLDPEEALEYRTCVDYSNQAAEYAGSAATRADTAEHQLYGIADKLKALAQDLNHINGEVMTATTRLPFVDTSPAEISEVLAREKTTPMSALRGQVANDTAAALESGTAATEAFGAAVQSVDERMGRL